jgi:hypothetical protein
MVVVNSQMTDYDHAEALLSLREAHDDEPVPRDELDADAQIIDDVARRGEIVEKDDGLVPTEAYERGRVAMTDGGEKGVRKIGYDRVSDMDEQQLLVRERDNGTEEIIGGPYVPKKAVEMEAAEEDAYLIPESEWSPYRARFFWGGDGLTAEETRRLVDFIRSNYKWSRAVQEFRHEDDWSISVHRGKEEAFGKMLVKLGVLDKEEFKEEMERRADDSAQEVADD